MSVMQDEFYFLLICLVVNISYSLLEGKREGTYYHLKYMSGLLDEYDEHPLFTLQRTLFYFLIFLSSFIIFKHDTALSAVIVISLMLQFTFYHDGAYYVERHNLNPSLYPKKFFDQSKTSKAFTDKFMTLPIRTAMMAIGTFVYVLILLIVR